MDGPVWLLLTATLAAPGPLAADARRPAPRLHLDRELVAEVQPLRALGESLARSAPRVRPRREGWVGVALHDWLAVLVDVHVEAMPRSLDPARPDAMLGLTARVGIELRPELALRL